MHADVGMDKKPCPKSHKIDAATISFEVAPLDSITFALKCVYTHDYNRYQASNSANSIFFLSYTEPTEQKADLGILIWVLGPPI